MVTPEENTRIEKFRRVAEQRETRAMQAAHRRGVADDLAARDARCAHPSAAFAAAVPRRSVCHSRSSGVPRGTSHGARADATTPSEAWPFENGISHDQTSRLRRMHSDADLLPVELAGHDVVLRRARTAPRVRESRRPIQVEQPRQRAAEAAGVEHEPRPVRRDFITGFRLVTTGRSPRNIDRRDLHFVADRRAAPRRFIGEHLVELRARHLERERIARPRICRRS